MYMFAIASLFYQFSTSVINVNVNTHINVILQSELQKSCNDYLIFYIDHHDFDSSYLQSDAKNVSGLVNLASADTFFIERNINIASK